MEQTQQQLTMTVAELKEQLETNRDARKVAEMWLQEVSDRRHADLVVAKEQLERNQKETKALQKRLRDIRRDVKVDEEQLTALHVELELVRKQITALHSQSVASNALE
eukprot:TRINITY_DN1701_c0_g2_i5.p1 TRINITY_DN1701_c0_g2~~TRINITY_DN1701_c0_g2_i5.p1  ORF type:complete len:108 (+),score=32.62 TRINITY_DN1701_c0_g2_i5:587-910(+)